MSSRGQKSGETTAGTAQRERTVSANGKPVGRPRLSVEQQAARGEQKRASQRAAMRTLRAQRHGTQQTQRQSAKVNAGHTLAHFIGHALLNLLFGQVPGPMRALLQNVATSAPPPRNAGQHLQVAQPRGARAATAKTATPAVTGTPAERYTALSHLMNATQDQYNATRTAFASANRSGDRSNADKALEQARELRAAYRALSRQRNELNYTPPEQQTY